MQGANVYDGSCLDSAETLLRFYVGSRGEEISWSIRSTSHRSAASPTAQHIEIVLPLGALEGKDYDSSYFGFGYEATVS